MSDERLEIRVYGDESKPTLVYLPGLHGDWTLVGGFRRAIAGKVRFVEMTYPRTLTWSLEDYAREIEAALAERGINGGWLLGESFGSQVLWSIVGRRQFKVEGVILAGGFVRHPMQWGVRLAERIAGGVSLGLITLVLFGYARMARFRYRHSPETQASIHEFIARRTELDRQAAKHRLRLVAESDFCKTAREAEVPVYGLTGVLDPIVPWFWIRSWLRKNCASLREYRVLRTADHNVLGTAPDAAAEQVASWIAGVDGLIRASV